MKNLKYIYFTLLFLIVFSCSDDFVDVASEDENSEEFFNSENDYQLALVAAYDYLQTTAKFYQYAEIASDNTLCGGESATDSPYIQEIDDMIHSPVGQSDGGLRTMWQWMYEAVNRCNYIMEFQDKTDFPNKTSVIAQTRFLRAYYNFILVKWWGDVPMLVDKRIQFGDQFTIDRTPKGEVYALIEEDLIFAAANLPYIQNETGRVTKGAAQGLLGRVYLYQDKFAEAADVLEDLINNGPHRLLTSDEYPNMFERDWENNIESVFEIQYSDVDGGSYDCFQCLEGNYTTFFNGPRDFIDSTGKFDAGYSFNIPTQEAVDAFEPGDLRFETTILDIEQYIADNPGSSYDANAGYEQTGYFNRKYIARKGDLDIADAALTNPDNYRAIRYADVLLMAAEALNRGGISDTRAQNYLNQVRNRAMLPSVSTTGTNLTNDIYKERRVELFGEGHRFFDLVRTGRAAQAIDGFVSGKHELFPIPIEEINLSGGRWAQNPGY
ncbi:RagB/SusD family nutrient uptake outer membrane protein [Seonamhaeicola sediminis]|uniref:RagB/SusD family nutrient uptake outer membrane protein n=1 Tax=Seonamhaeicola sediminis TaxID=2528206 RepID=A0A562YGM7_9FLAO|nr:RagB/SusD family nutrient uptake outer membrane protein [Seonamhaeicola sediminis]TWO34027.1 RagB/SusD family nutrient uptake outer membrane protein [Seonamhaeicola sediminis]